MHVFFVCVPVHVCLAFLIFACVSVKWLIMYFWMYFCVCLCGHIYNLF